MSRTALTIFASLALWVYAGPVPTLAQERSLTEDCRLHTSFHSKFLAKDRDVIVWLPPGYKSETMRRYPVLYMHDGMSAFVSWRLDETALALISNKQIEHLLIVFVGNGGTGEARFDEYTPTRDTAYPKSGNADNYGRMLIEELKPFIDSEYRTSTAAESTGLGGASLGGLVTVYLGLKHPTTFGRLAVLSPSVWWDRGMILREVKSLPSKPSLRIWLDVGTNEGSSDKQARLLRDALKSKGWVLDSDLSYFEAKGATHDEEAFARRGALFLKYLFPKRTNDK